MYITLVRHGETDYNKKKILQGYSNIPLNDNGRKTCYELKEKLKNKHFDICFSSPLMRTMETAMILVGDRVLIERDDRLIERFLGDLEGKAFKLYNPKKYWNYNLNSSDSGVEDVQSIFKRCNSFLKDLEEKYSDKSVLIVAHSAIIKALYHIIKNTDLNSDLSSLKIDNCGYIELSK